MSDLRKLYRDDLGPWWVGPHYKSDVDSAMGRVADCKPFESPVSFTRAEVVAAAPAMLQRLIYAERLLLQGQHEEALEQVQLGLAGEWER